MLQHADTMNLVTMAVCDRFVPRWCDLDLCDRVSCYLLTEVAVVSCVAQAHENALRQVERHAMGDP